MNWNKKKKVNITSFVFLLYIAVFFYKKLLYTIIKKSRELYQGL